MRKSRVIIIGASYLQVPLIEKANNLGIETHVFAWEEGSLGKDLADYFYPISITEKELILNQARAIEPDGILSIASDLAIITVNFVAHALGLPSNSPKCTELTTNKILMRQRLTEKGLPCPAFYIVKEPVNISHIKTDFPLIVKPSDRSGSRGITLVNNKTELLSAIDYALKESFNKTAIVEEFIKGREISVETITLNGEHIYITSTDKVTTGAPHFVELEHHQPSRLNTEVEQQIIEISKKALSALCVTTGAAHIEYILQESGEIILTEVGARMGGDHIGARLVQLSTGFDYLKACIDLSLGKTVKVNAPSCDRSGILFQDFNLNDINSLFGTEVKIEVVEQYSIKPNTEETIQNSSDRSRYTIYKVSK